MRMTVRSLSMKRLANGECIVTESNGDLEWRRRTSILNANGKNILAGFAGIVLKNIIALLIGVKVDDWSMIVAQIAKQGFKKVGLLCAGPGISQEDNSSELALVHVCNSVEKLKHPLLTFYPVVRVVKNWAAHQVQSHE